MATHGRRTKPPIADTLFTQGHRFNFYQAVRLLEILAPGKSSVGVESSAEKETIRFKSLVGAAFPASDIDSIIPSQDENGPAQMTVNLMGLAGCLGPLPAVYTELIQKRAWRKDTAFKAFLDIFNHRLLSLLYRTRTTFRPGFEFKLPQHSRIASFFFSLMGLGTEGLRSRMQIPDRALMFYCAYLSQKPANLAVLENMLKDYFKAPVKGVQFCGQWRHIESDQLTRLGKNGQNRRLGQSAFLGRRIWDQSGKFELHIGPLPAARFIEFLPPGCAFGALCELTRFYVGSILEFEFVLLPDLDDPPVSGLGGTYSPRLGWTSWLGAGPPEIRLDRLRFAPREYHYKRREGGDRER